MAFKYRSYEATLRNYVLVNLQETAPKAVFGSLTLTNLKKHAIIWVKKRNEVRS